MEDSELESFRRRWREEVSARSKGQGAREDTNPTPTASGPGRPAQKAPPALPKSSSAVENEPEVEGRTYHDLENKEDHLKLGNEQIRSQADVPKEPTSALEHYEKAVERETQGNLGDSVNLYRRAFKLDSRVQETYKKKHFPPAVPSLKPNQTNPSNASATVPNPAHHSLDGPSSTLSELLDDFSKLSIPPAEPESSFSSPPPCPVARVPEEVIVEILLSAAITDVADLARLAQVCKRFAYLIISEERLWRRLSLGSEFGFAAMHYRYACDYRGHPLHDNDEDVAKLRSSLRRPTAPLSVDLTPSVYPTYRNQFRNRPRIRFNGCYISTVNYTRPGGASTSLGNWNSPVHIVTYYRYLRFFRDGRVISLLTTSEPVDVVHHLTFENIHGNHSGALPTAVMKDALKGRWRLTGTSKPAPFQFCEDEDQDTKGPGDYAIEPAVPTDGDLQKDGVADLAEAEGDLHVETQGVVPKYMWKMHFSLGHSGRKDGTRNNKLSWKGFWSYNRLTDDWGEFLLKNDRPFYWSRVKSYGLP